MPRACIVQQLRVLSGLLEGVIGADPEGRVHARRVLDLVDEQPESVRRQLSMPGSAQKLANLHFGRESEGGVAFAHWHVEGPEDCTPLWLRRSIIGRMKLLSGRRHACLLVTGLREAVCPEGGYWTRRREARYRRMRDWIDGLAATWAPKGANLQVIVL